MIMLNKTQQSDNSLHLQHNSEVIYSFANRLKESFKAVFDMLNSKIINLTFNKNT